VSGEAEADTETATTTAMRSVRAKILVATIAAGLLYLAWRWSAFPDGAEDARTTDTMCFASRIGLPCAQ
jgi:hypothetical protein